MYGRNETCCGAVLHCITALSRSCRTLRSFGGCNAKPARRHVVGTGNQQKGLLAFTWSYLERLHHRGSLVCLDLTISRCCARAVPTVSASSFLPLSDDARAYTTHNHQKLLDVPSSSHQDHAPQLHADPTLERPPDQPCLPARATRLSLL
jgi:hypothetical protein